MTANEVEAYSAVDEENNKKKNEDNNKEIIAVTNTMSLTSADNNNGKQRGRRDRSPIVKGRSVKGTVKWFSVRKGYGFISRDDVDEDIFFHGSSIVRQTRAALMLAENQKVEFDIVKGIKGLLEAACVSGPDGNRVGSIIGEGGGFRRGTFRRRIAGEPGNSERSGGDNQPKAIANGQQNTKAKRNINKRGPPPSKNPSTEDGKTVKDEDVESQKSLGNCTATIEKTDPKSEDEEDSAAEGKN